MEKSKLSNPILAAIESKCGNIISLTMVWQSVAHMALESGADDKDTLELLSGFRSPRNLESLLTTLASEGTPPGVFLEKLRESADESRFTLAAWLSAFEIVQARLVRDSRSASPGSIAGYIQCAAEFGSNAGNGDGLPAIVLCMLDQYGFEGQEGCGTSGRE